MEEQGGQVIKQTIFKFDVDMTDLNKSSKQLIEIQQKYQAELQKTEAELIDMKKRIQEVYSAGFGIQKERDIPLLGQLASQEVNITKKVRDIRLQLEYLSEVEGTIRNVMQQSGAAIQESAIKTEQALSRVQSTTSKAVANIVGDNKALGAVIEATTAEAGARYQEMADDIKVAQAQIQATLSRFKMPIMSASIGTEGVLQGLTGALDFGEEMGGVSKRGTGYTVDEVANQYERFLQSLGKGTPILMKQTDSLRVYRVAWTELTDAIIKVKMLKGGLLESGMREAVGIEISSGTSIDTYRENLIGLTRDNYRLVASFKEGEQFLSVFMKALDGVATSIRVLRGQISGEWESIGNLINVENREIKSKKLYLETIDKVINAKIENKAITTTLTAEELKAAAAMMQLYAGEKNWLKLTQEEITLQNARVNAFMRGNVVITEESRLLGMVASNEQKMAQALNQTAQVKSKVAAATQDFIDVEFQEIGADGKVVDSQNRIQAELKQSVTGWEALTRALAEGAAAGALAYRAVGGAAPAADVLAAAFGAGGAPQRRRTTVSSQYYGDEYTGGGGRGGRGGGGAAGEGGRTNPAMEFRDEIARAMEDLQRMTNVRDYPGLVVLQKELDILRQKLILLADESREGQVVIESAGDMAQEYVMTAKEFTSLWSGINKVASELERAEKSFRSFAEMKPGTAAQSEFIALERYIKDAENELKLGTITATEFYRRLQIVGEAVGTTGKSADILTAALSRTFKAMQSEKAAKFREALAKINLELLKTRNVGAAIKELEKLKTEYADNTQNVLRLSKAIKTLQDNEKKGVSKNLLNYLEEEKAKVTAGYSTLERYIELIKELKATIIESGSFGKIDPEPMKVLNKELLKATTELNTQKIKEFNLELTKIRSEAKGTTDSIDPLVARLKELREQWAGNDAAMIKIDNTLRMVQQQFANNNLGAFKERLAGIKAEFDLSNISAREYYERLQALLPEVAVGSEAFNVLAAAIRKAQTAMDTTATKEYKASIQGLTAQAAAHAITQRQLIAGLEALRPQVEGNAAAMNHLEIAIAKARRGMGDMGVVLGTLGKLWKTAGHHAMWMMSGAFIMPLYNLPNAIAETAKKLDTSFAKLKTVLMLDPEISGSYELLNEKMKELEELSFYFAKRYGEDIEKVNEVLFTVGQRYKKTADIAVVSNAIMKQSVLDSNESVEETAKLLLSVAAQYKIAPRDIDNFINKVNIAQNVVRATSSEVLEALSRSASVFLGVGADIDTSISLIAASLEQTGRSAEVVGTSWQNMLLRFGGGVTKVTKVLNSYGIEVFNSLQQTEDFAKTIESIREKYSRMTDEMRVKFVSDIAGVRQTKVLKPLLDDLNAMDNTIKRVRESISGTREELASIVDKATLVNLMTYERRIKSVSAVWGMFILRMSKSEKVKNFVFGFLSGLISLMIWIDRHSQQLLTLVKAMGLYVGVARGVIPVLKMIGVGFVMAKTVINQTTLAINMLAATQSKMAVFGTVVSGSLKAIGLMAKSAAIQIGAMVVVAQLAATAQRMLMDPEEKKISRYEGALAALNLAESVGYKKNVSGREEGLGGAVKSIPGELLLSFKYGFNRQGDLLAAQAALDAAGGNYEKARKILENIHDELKAEKWEEESKRAFGFMQNLLDEYQKGSSKDNPFTDVDRDIRATGDETDKTTEASKRFNEEMKQIDAQTKRTLKTYESFMKILERQRSVLADITKVLPGQTPSSARFRAFQEQFDINLADQNDALLLTLNTMDEIKNQYSQVKGVQADLTKYAQMYADSIASVPVSVGEAGNALRKQAGELLPLYEKYAQMYNLPIDMLLAVSKAESGFNTKAKSKKGAMGLMQLMPGTAKRLGVKDAYDPEQNIAGGAKYLKQLVDEYFMKYGWKGVLAGYNAGPKAVERYKGVPPYDETQKYIENIAGYLGTTVSEIASDRLVEALNTNIETTGGKLDELEQKYQELGDSVSSSYRTSFELLSEYSQAIGTFYDLLYSEQNNYNDWLRDNGWISQMEWESRLTKQRDALAKKYSEMAIDITEVQKRIDEDVANRNTAFFDSIGAALEELDIKRRMLLDVLSKANTLEKRQAVVDNIKAIDLERGAYVELVAAGREYLNNFVKPNIASHEKLYGESLQLTELYIQMLDIEKQRRDIKNAFWGPSKDAMKLGYAAGSYYTQYIEDIMADEADYIKMMEREKKLRQDHLEGITDQVMRSQGLLEIERIDLTIAKKKLDTLNEIKAVMDEQAQIQRFLNEQRYEYLKLGATEQQEKALEIQNIERQIQENLQDIERNKNFRVGHGLPTDEYALMRDAGIRENIQNIVDLRIELLKLDPVFSKINELAREAVDNMKEAIRENIAAVVSGEKSLGGALADMFKRRTEIMKETMTEAFSEAVIIKMGGALGDFEKQMQDLSSAIFGLFGLTAPDKRPVLDKVYDPNNNALRMIMADKSGFAGSIAQELLGGARAGGAGGNVLAAAFGAFGIGGGAGGAGSTDLGGGAYGPPESPEVVAAKKRAAKRAAYQQLGYDMAGQYLSQRAAQEFAGPGGPGPGSEMGAAAGYAMGAAGSIFGGLGAAAGPVGMIAGAIVGAVADNAFGVGRGEQRRQAMANQDEQRQADIDARQSRYEALGFSEEYTKAKAAAVPNYVMESERSFLGLSGTSRAYSAQSAAAVAAELARQDAMLTIVENAVKGYNDAIKKTDYYVSMGAGKISEYGKAVNGLNVDFQGGRNTVRMYSEALLKMMVPVSEGIKGTGVYFTYLNDQIETTQHWLDEMTKGLSGADIAAVQATDAFMQMTVELWKLKNQAYWSSIFDPLKAVEIAIEFDKATQEDLQKATLVKLDTVGESLGHIAKNGLPITPEEVDALEKIIIAKASGYTQMTPQEQSDFNNLYTLLKDNQAMDVQSRDLATSAVGTGTVGEAIAGTAQVVQNYNTFEVNADNFFSTKTEMLNISKEIATMIKQQGWIDSAVFNI